jgi:DNA-binding NtrC family response regulator
VSIPSLGVLQQPDSGQDLFRRIPEINPKATVIMASGFIDPETTSEMYKAGLKHFTQKPYLHDEVLQTIREVIHSNG